MPPRRTIALLHYTAPPVVGGVEQVVGRHADLLAAAGHRVRVVAGRGGPGDGRVELVRVPRADTRHPEIVRTQAALAGGRVPAGFARLTAELADELAAALAGADVVAAHNVGSLGRNLALTAALHAVATAPGAPRTLLWHHDLAWARPADRATLHERDPWDLLRTPWPGVTHVAISEARRDEVAAVMGLAPAEIRVVPNGIDLARVLGLARSSVELIRATGLLDRWPLLLLPARLTPRKNVALAIRVVAALRASGHPDAGLVVTGPDDPHDPAGRGHLAGLLALRDALGLRDAVVLLAERLPHPATDVLVRDLFRVADALILPSLDEGFGIPVLEAGAHRLPIVCSDLPALRSLAGDAALYVDPADDPAEIADRLAARLAADPAAELAHRVRTEHTWEAVYCRVLEPVLLGSG